MQSPVERSVAEVGRRLEEGRSDKRGERELTITSSSGAAMLTNIRRLWKDEEGPTAVEYGLMVALIAVAIIGTVTALGGSLVGIFTAVSAAIAGA